MHLTLGDLRQVLWLPDRQIYWAVCKGGRDGQAHRLLHAVKVVALDQGFTVSMAGTLLTHAVFKLELAVVARHGLTIKREVFDVPREVLRASKEARGAVDPSHPKPEAMLRLAYDTFTAPAAWWRSLPPGKVETIRT